MTVIIPQNFNCGRVGETFNAEATSETALFVGHPGTKLRKWMQIWMQIWSMFDIATSKGYIVLIEHRNAMVAVCVTP